MSNLMGWRGSVAHAHYGKLGRRVADEIGWLPTEQDGYDGYDVSKLVLGSRSQKGEFQWTLRPEIARALELLAWPELLSNDTPELGGSTEGVIEHAARTWQLILERNGRAAGLAKAQHGYRCQACDMTFSDVYGAIGADFIEAHHLMPLSSIDPDGERIYAPEDFAVLCSNCHRMIHRWPDRANPQPWDLDGFKRMLRARLTP
jgi:predicted HNH restriction endonuclease